MPDSELPPEKSVLQRRALSRWENEGGAPKEAIQGIHEAGPELTNAELVHLRIRVIALENLLIALLAEAPERQLNIVQEMAEYISPRAGSTHHPLTIQAAEHMTDLVKRAVHFRTAQTS